MKAHTKLPLLVTAMACCASLLAQDDSTPPAPPSPTASATAPVAQNLLKNGDFGQDLTGWTVGKPGGTPVEGKVVKAEIASDPSQKSGKVLRLTDENPQSGLTVYQDVPCSAGAAYILSVNSQSASEEKKGVGYVQVTFLGQDNKEMSYKTPEERQANSKAITITLPGEGFKTTSAEFVVPAGAVKARIRCSAGSGSVGIADIAEVRLVPKPL